MTSELEFKLCRLCLCKSSRLIDIFQENCTSIFSVVETIRDLLALRPVPNPEFQWLVCSMCLFKLTDFRLFKQRCLESKMTFESRFTGVVSATKEEQAIGPDRLIRNVSVQTDIKLEDLPFSGADVPGSLPFYAANHCEVSFKDDEPCSYDEFITSDLYEPRHKIPRLEVDGAPPKSPDCSDDVMEVEVTPWMVKEEEQDSEDDEEEEESPQRIQGDKTQQLEGIAPNAVPDKVLSAAVKPGKVKLERTSGNEEEREGVPSQADQCSGSTKDNASSTAQKPSSLPVPINLSSEEPRYHLLPDRAHGSSSSAPCCTENCIHGNSHCKGKVLDRTMIDLTTSPEPNDVRTPGTDGAASYGNASEIKSGATVGGEISGGTTAASGNVLGRLQDFAKTLGPGILLPIGKAMPIAGTSLSGQTGKESNPGESFVKSSPAVSSPTAGTANVPTVGSDIGVKTGQVTNSNSDSSSVNVRSANIAGVLGNVVVNPGQVTVGNSGLSVTDAKNTNNAGVSSKAGVNSVPATVGNSGPTVVDSGNANITGVFGNLQVNPGQVTVSNSDASGNKMSTGVVTKFVVNPGQLTVDSGSAKIDAGDANLAGIVGNTNVYPGQSSVGINAQSIDPKGLNISSSQAYIALPNGLIVPLMINPCMLGNMAPSTMPNVVPTLSVPVNSVIGRNSATPETNSPQPPAVPSVSPSVMVNNPPGNLTFLSTFLQSSNSTDVAANLGKSGQTSSSNSVHTQSAVLSVSPSLLVKNPLGSLTFMSALGNAVTKSSAVTDIVTNVDESRQHLSPSFIRTQSPLPSVAPSVTVDNPPGDISLMSAVDNTVAQSSVSTDIAANPVKSGQRSSLNSVHVLPDDGKRSRTRELAEESDPKKKKVACLCRHVWTQTESYGPGSRAENDPPPVGIERKQLMWMRISPTSYRDKHTQTGVDENLHLGKVCHARPTPAFEPIHGLNTGPFGEGGGSERTDDPGEISILNADTRIYVDPIITLPGVHPEYDWDKASRNVRARLMSEVMRARAAQVTAQNVDESASTSKDGGCLGNMTVQGAEASEGFTLQSGRGRGRRKSSRVPDERLASDVRSNSVPQIDANNSSSLGLSHARVVVKEEVEAEKLSECTEIVDVVGAITETAQETVTSKLNRTDSLSMDANCTEVVVKAEIESVTETIQSQTVAGGVNPVKTFQSINDERGILGVVPNVSSQRNSDSSLLDRGGIGKVFVKEEVQDSYEQESFQASSEQSRISEARKDNIQFGNEGLESGSRDEIATHYDARDLSREGHALPGVAVKEEMKNVAECEDVSAAIEEVPSEIDATGFRSEYCRAGIANNINRPVGAGYPSMEESLRSVPTPSVQVTSRTEPGGFIVESFHSTNETFRPNIGADISTLDQRNNAAPLHVENTSQETVSTNAEAFVKEWASLRGQINVDRGEGAQSVDEILASKPNPLENALQRGETTNGETLVKEEVQNTGEGVLLGGEIGVDRSDGALLSVNERLTSEPKLSPQYESEDDDSTHEDTGFNEDIPGADEEISAQDEDAAVSTNDVSVSKSPGLCIAGSVGSSDGLLWKEGSKKGSRRENIVLYSNPNSDSGPPRKRVNVSALIGTKNTSKYRVSVTRPADRCSMAICGRVLASSLGTWQPPYTNLEEDLECLSQGSDSSLSEKAIRKSSRKSIQNPSKSTDQSLLSKALQNVTTNTPQSLYASPSCSVLAGGSEGVLFTDENPLVQVNSAQDADATASKPVAAVSTSPFDLKSVDSCIRIAEVTRTFNTNIYSSVDSNSSQLESESVVGVNTVQSNERNASQSVDKINLSSVGFDFTRELYVRPKASPPSYTSDAELTGDHGTSAMQTEEVLWSPSLESSNANQTGKTVGSKVKKTVRLSGGTNPKKKVNEKKSQRTNSSRTPGSTPAVRSGRKKNVSPGKVPEQKAKKMRSERVISPQPDGKRTPVKANPSFAQQRKSLDDSLGSLDDLSVSTSDEESGLSSDDENVLSRSGRRYNFRRKEKSVKDTSEALDKEALDFEQSDSEEVDDSDKEWEMELTESEKEKLKVMCPERQIDDLTEKGMVFLYEMELHRHHYDPRRKQTEESVPDTSCPSNNDADMKTTAVPPHKEKEISSETCSVSQSLKKHPSENATLIQKEDKKSESLNSKSRPKRPPKSSQKQSHVVSSIVSDEPRPFQCLESPLHLMEKLCGAKSSPVADELCLSQSLHTGKCMEPVPYSLHKQSSINSSIVGNEQSLSQFLNTGKSLNPVPHSLHKQSSINSSVVGNEQSLSQFLNTGKSLNSVPHSLHKQVSVVGNEDNLSNSLNTGRYLEPDLNSSREQSSVVLGRVGNEPCLTPPVKAESSEQPSLYSFQQQSIGDSNLVGIEVDSSQTLNAVSCSEPPTRLIYQQSGITSLVSDELCPSQFLNTERLLFPPMSPEHLSVDFNPFRREHAHPLWKQSTENPSPEGDESCSSPSLSSAKPKRSKKRKPILINLSDDEEQETVVTNESKSNNQDEKYVSSKNTVVEVTLSP
ncbi:uncharacterized protein LOC124172654 [Ischnura elegans]|uniref:uncharacterized protein LOC124172654 n=1 Tax=Ischnura elegans TaxID=197161 RepID=UPI001ED8747F|nr:uncharacterized protein LOC124172654 [Ischnura elegans]